MTRKALSSLNRTFYGIETGTAAVVRGCRAVLIVPFMELKPARVEGWRCARLS